LICRYLFRKLCKGIYERKEGGREGRTHTQEGGREGGAGRTYTYLLLLQVLPDLVHALLGLSHLAGVELNVIGIEGLEQGVLARAVGGCVKEGGERGREGGRMSEMT
jgi:hypothetical protein